MSEGVDKKDVAETRFREGDLVLLVDRKGRRYMLTLRSGESFHTHLGYIDHSDLIKRQVGDWCFTTKGHRLLALKPTLGDYVQEMRRVTQVVYPKDIGAILLLGDIFPGANVVEAGFGSGALSLALVRAVGDRGSVTSYELRSGQSEIALKNIAPLLPEGHRLTIKEGDIYESIPEVNVDRLVLDVPEPWHVAPLALEALVPGGIFLSFVPTVLQVHRLVEALNVQKRYQLIETVEVMLRPWHVTSRSVRPTHRMVAHTGFITTARKCAEKPGELEAKTDQTEGQADE